MTKKDFSNMNNPAANYMDEMSAAATKPQKKRTTNHKAKVAKNSSESRSQHTSFLLKPSTAKSLKFIAKFEGTSANDIANKLLDQYVADYRKKPSRARKLDQAMQLFD